MTRPPSEHTFEDLFVGQIVTFSEKIDELNQETDTLLEEIDKWQM